MAVPHLPRLVIVVRHGESEANCDWNVHCHVPNHAVKLTHQGIDQAAAAGREIRSLIEKGEKIAVYKSPCKRTRQTSDEIVKALKELPDNEIEVREDPRLREQDFGNFQDPETMQAVLKERNIYGFFFYRIPNGESPADVYDRCSSFFDTLYRHFDRHQPDVVILVSHGIWGRVFLMRWFYWPYEKFEKLENLPNAKPIIMERSEAGYKLLTELSTWE